MKYAKQQRQLLKTYKSSQDTQIMASEKKCQLNFYHYSKAQIGIQNVES